MSDSTTFAPGTVLVLVGTKRGLFLLSSRDRARWEVSATGLSGRRIFYATLDQRGGHRMFAADNGDFSGSFLCYSDDFGQTWHEPERGIQFPEGSERKLENIWTIEPGRTNEPGTLYAGVDPTSLWISSDNGVHWSLNEGLANHPTRDRWVPDAGGLCLHTIVVDPTKISPSSPFAMDARNPGTSTDGQEGVRNQMRTAVEAGRASRSFSLSVLEEADRDGTNGSAGDPATARVAQVSSHVRAAASGGTARSVHERPRARRKRSGGGHRVRPRSGSAGRAAS